MINYLNSNKNESLDNQFESDPSSPKADTAGATAAAALGVSTASSKLVNPTAASERQRPAPQAFQRLPPEAFNPSGTVVKLNEEQIAKLNSELDVVDSNVQVLNEILTEIQTNSSSDGSKAASLVLPEPNDLALVTELNKTCREMQKRVTQLIGNISNESVIGELLRVNDDLNNVFLRYERFERSIGLAPQPGAAAAAAAAQLSPPQRPPQPSPVVLDANKTGKTAAVDKPLIDFTEDDDDGGIAEKMKPLTMSEKSTAPASKSDQTQEFTDINAV
jgi:hypothetical protein